MLRITKPRIRRPLALEYFTSELELGPTYLRFRFGDEPSLLVDHIATGEV